MEGSVGSWIASATSASGVEPRRAKTAETTPITSIAPTSIATHFRTEGGWASRAMDVKEASVLREAPAERYRADIATDI